MSEENRLFRLERWSDYMDALTALTAPIAPRGERISAREVLDRIDRINDLTAGELFVYYTGYSLVGKRLWAWDNTKGRTVDLQKAAWTRYEIGKITLHVKRRGDGLYDYIAIGK